MRYSVVFFLISIVCGLSAQKASDSIDIFISPTYEKITVTVKSEKMLISDLKLNITDGEGKIIKSVQLQEKQLPNGNTIYIHDIAIGNYCYSLLRGSKEIMQGEFTTDIYDSL